MKVYLLKYKPQRFQALNSGGFTYDLTTLEVKFFGLFKSEKEVKYTVPEHASIKTYTDHWDNIIENNLLLE
jgi:hypothetical protein